MGIYKEFGNHWEGSLTYTQGDDRRGLTTDEATKRLGQYGPNKLAEARKDSHQVMFLKQFGNPLLIILLVGAVIAIASLPTLALSVLKEIFGFGFL